MQLSRTNNTKLTHNAAQQVKLKKFSPVQDKLLNWGVEESPPARSNSDVPECVKDQDLPKCLSIQTTPIFTHHHQKFNPPLELAKLHS